MTVLDVACGLHPRGDVNVDLLELGSIHRRKGKGPMLKVDEIPGFVNADAMDMYMFKDRQFARVHCWHLIEHIPYPDCWDLLRELWRVTGGRLTVVCPNRRWLKFPHLKRSKVHISNFDAQVFKKAVPSVLGTRNFEAKNIYRGMFHKMIPFPLWPMLVRLDVWRDRI